MTEKRHEKLGLTDQDVIKMYRYMVLTRGLDERMWLLNRAGKVPFVVSCKGQEAAQIGAAFALNPLRDYVLPYYRDLGVVLVFGQTAKDVMLSAFAKSEDPNSGGRQMPGHFGSREHHIVTGSSPVSTQIPHAVGIALAAKMKGDRLVAYTSFGEGSSNQGDFHEAANFAGVHHLPVVFFCENNKYAISVPLRKELACERVSDRAAGYGFPGVTVDGNDPLAVYQAMQEAVTRALNGEGPSLVEAMVDRLNPHSSDDDDRTYRSKEELEEAKRQDPIFSFRDYLLACGVLTEESERALRDEVTADINAATAYAEQAPYPEPEQALRYVFAE
ncbi:thiamine pyrophosphate-dependent dehydrogenase E1 component subunit alpha [Sulfoacidibacillus thermotolerans]|uniref:2-oxoisovalerate dehydrogenase subunit alpha n=1 Tax=Sulfoacidibacillus thermotolerans TaxID=1765684 RepID=A0A2U3DCH8_SULT2|nr:thiamine pyrophosphate-dependent dehydrogenase E1 component subunit alpha [Sulfoacidibacillus thermotolerans]PWI58990.1 2-oxoisovalerate dehydrogenase [Sulfoacidibacillus thermotolerans]